MDTVDRQEMGVMTMMAGIWKTFLVVGMLLVSTVMLCSKKKNRRRKMKRKRKRKRKRKMRMW